MTSPPVPLRLARSAMATTDWHVKLTDSRVPLPLASSFTYCRYPARSGSPLEQEIVELDHGNELQSAAEN